MQKYLINLTFFTCVALAIYALRQATLVGFTEKQIKRAEQRQEKQKELSEQRLQLKKAVKEQRRLVEEPVKVLVRAKDVRVCLKEPNTDTISNEVVECTKDHYITVKRRDAEL